MTWDQIELFANAAADRAKHAILLDARTSALGMAVGFSGDDKPLKTLARSMEIEYGGSRVSAANPETERDMRDAIGKLAEQGDVRIKRHGTNRRRADSRAGSENARVPARATARRT